MRSSFNFKSSENAVREFASRHLNGPTPFFLLVFSSVVE
jgi:hypothetical protein